MLSGGAQPFVLRGRRAKAAPKSARPSLGRAHIERRAMSEPKSVYVCAIERIKSFCSLFVFAAFLEHFIACCGGGRSRLFGPANEASRAPFMATAAVAVAMAATTAAATTTTTNKSDAYRRARTARSTPATGNSFDANVNVVVCALVGAHLVLLAAERVLGARARLHLATFATRVRATRYCLRARARARANCARTHTDARTRRTTSCVARLVVSAERASERPNETFGAHLWASIARERLIG